MFGFKKHAARAIRDEKPVHYHQLTRPVWPHLHIQHDDIRTDSEGNIILTGEELQREHRGW